MSPRASRRPARREEHQYPGRQRDAPTFVRAARSLIGDRDWLLHDFPGGNNAQHITVLRLALFRREGFEQRCEDFTRHDGSLRHSYRAQHCQSPDQPKLSFCHESPGKAILNEHGRMPLSLKEIGKVHIRNAANRRRCRPTGRENQALPPRRGAAAHTDGHPERPGAPGKFIENSTDR